MCEKSGRPRLSVFHHSEDANWKHLGKRDKYCRINPSGAMIAAMPTTDPLHPERLKDKQRALRDGFALPLTLRVHRALSWLLRAHREEEDLDMAAMMVKVLKGLS